jgi:hypothetical protein
LQLAHLQGWRCYHTFDSRRSAPGFPDLVLVRGESLLFVECETDRGGVSPAQAQWIEALRGTGAEVRLWRPVYWDEIKARLRRSGSERPATRTRPNTDGPPNRRHP